jgi:NADH-ubiquinone oxidoreductase chain 4
LILESSLLATFLVLDILYFYVFFESTLIPLFLLVGMFGSANKIRASYYLFLYTLAGSLFMLLAILVISSIGGTTDLSVLYKLRIDLNLQK